MRLKVSAALIGIAAATGVAATLIAAQSQAGDRYADRDTRAGGRDAQCVSTPLKGSRVIDDHTIMVADWHGNAAVLTLTGPCLDKHTGGVRIKLVGIQDEICRADDVDTIADVSPASLGVCAVRSVELLSRDDAENRAPNRGVW